ncbi:MAG: hypothetical protein ABEJ23_05565 [Haloarculaceae archaeon]
MGVVKAHERANESIAELNEAVAEWTTATDAPDDGVDARPKHVSPLPDVDYGTVEGCDEALRAAAVRTAQLAEIRDGAAVGGARDEALSALRDLQKAIGAQRARLAVADDDD